MMPDFEGLPRRPGAILLNAFLTDVNIKLNCECHYARVAVTDLNLKDMFDQWKIKRARFIKVNNGLLSGVEVK